MFKEENIEIISKIFCFIIFLLVISFLNNIYSLLLLFGYFFLFDKKNYNAVFSLLSLLTLLGLACGFITDNFVLLKVALVMDYGYYFMRDFKVNKRFLIFERQVINDEETVSEQVMDEKIIKELKKGKQLKQGDIDLIKSHLNEKSNDDDNEKRTVKYLRFSTLKNPSWKWKWQFSFDDINGLYVMCHLILLVFVIVVE